MKKKILLALLFILSLSLFADETFNCRRETYVYDYRVGDSFIVNLFTKEDLRILSNTIYAKYGYTFKSKDLKVIFNEMDWYSPKENFKESFRHLDSAILEVIKLGKK